MWEIVSWKDRGSFKVHQIFYGNLSAEPTSIEFRILINHKMHSIEAFGRFWCSLNNAGPPRKTTKLLLACIPSINQKIFIIFAKIRTIHTRKIARKVFIKLKGLLLFKDFLAEFAKIWTNSFLTADNISTTKNFYDLQWKIVYPILLIMVATIIFDESVFCGKSQMICKSGCFWQLHTDKQFFCTIFFEQQKVFRQTWFTKKGFL